LYSDYVIVKDKIELTPEIDVNGLISKLHAEYSKEETNITDGLKIDFDDGWVHLRKSNTEPIIRVYAEANTSVLAQKLANELKDKTLSLI